MSTTFTLLQAGDCLIRRALFLQTAFGTRHAASWLFNLGVPCELAVLLLARR